MPESEGHVMQRVFQHTAWTPCKPHVNTPSLIGQVCVASALCGLHVENATLVQWLLHRSGSCRGCSGFILSYLRQVKSASGWVLQSQIFFKVSQVHVRTKRKYELIDPVKHASSHLHHLAARLELSRSIETRRAALSMDSGI